ncbi:unnamed protein product [Calypogeia fissa]
MAKNIGRGSILVGMLLLATALCARAAYNLDIPMIIIFGDSTVDVGTNNYLTTLVKSDFKPYGRDCGEVGTGRFSNGLLVPDFIAQDVGLHSPLAFLDPEANGEKLLWGINFASSGSGFMQSTADIFNVRSFTQQLEDFKTYTSNLIALVGPSRAEELMSKAIYVISTGSNDWVNNYFLVGRATYSIPEWHDQIRNSIPGYFKEIYNAGARRILVASLPAIGCIPAAISLFGDGTDECVSYINEAAVDMNSAIQSIIGNFQSSGAMPGVKFLYVDTYSDLLGASQNPSAYGFEEARKACCGSGMIEVAILCNADSPGTCSDASKYLFFDSFHPSQKFYEMVAQNALGKIVSTF